MISSMEMRAWLAGWPGWDVTNHITPGISKSDADRLAGTDLAVGGGLVLVVFYL